MARTKRSVWASASAFALKVGLCWTLLCAVAYAQRAADAQEMGPTGIRAGNLEIHPEFAVKGGYDTNVFKADGDGAGAQSKIEGAGLLTLTPGISLTTLGRARQVAGEDSAPAAPPKLELKAAAYATFFQYLGLTNPVSGEEQNLRGAEFDVSGDFHIMPKRPVSLVLGASWARNARPFTASAGEDEEEGDESGVKRRQRERKAQAYNTIVPRARLMFESRGGVLTAFVGFRPTISPYEGDAFKYLSSINYDADAGIGWRFFPSTSLLFDTTFTMVNYYKVDDSDVDPDSIQVLLSNSKRVRARLGVNGAFTRSLSLRVLAGYAAGMFDSPFLDEYEQPVGEAVLTYKFGGASQSSLEGGYTRNVTPAAVGGFMLMDRGFARLKFVLRRQFAISAEGGVGYVQYGKQVAPILMGRDVIGSRALGAGGEDERDDIRVDVALRAEYRALSWLGILAETIYQQNITDFDFGTTLTPDPAEYQVFQANLGLRASY